MYPSRVYPSLFCAGDSAFAPFLARAVPRKRFSSEVGTGSREENASKRESSILQPKPAI
jgi:hypothetical protein